jgi:pre-mRNA-splicing factor ATP-dependent RNA helicase DHX15/PRP43
MDIGILDPQGINKNPLTNLDYTTNFKELAKKWSSLPAYKNAKQIIKTLKKHQVFLVISGTGSGKTVLIPKFLLHSFDYKGKIGITLPKQILTENMASYASNILEVKMGNQVGYKYKGSPKNMYSNNTNLLYTTDGTIVQKLMNDPELKDFDGIIIDEAHERKVQIDIMLLLLKNVLKKRPNFKLVIMSATINPKIFENYFKDFDFKKIELSGKTNYPIESIYLDIPIKKNDYLDKGIDVIKKILNKENVEKVNNILFFVTSSNEAFEVCRKINKIKSEFKPICVELYANMPKTKEFLAVDINEYKKLGHNVKIIISTNVAESSLTVEGITYVIDSGYELSSTYEPKIRANKLELKYTSKAQILQRKGRTGRTGPGVCYHLYTENEFNKLKEYPEPDIRTSDLSSEFLGLLKNVKKVKELKKILKEMIEPPKKEYIKYILEDFKNLGLIKNKEITTKGEIISKIPVSNIYLGNCMLYSFLYNCSREMSLIVSLLELASNNMGKIFVRPPEDKKEEHKIAKDKFKHKYGDHLSIFNIIKKYKEKHKEIYGSKKKCKGELEEKIRKWCFDNFLNYKSLSKALKNSYRLQKNPLTDTKKDKVIGMDIEDRILYSFIKGLETKTAKLEGNMYKTDYTSKVKISRQSYIKKDVKKVVFNELFIQNEKELNIVSEIPKKLIK